MILMKVDFLFISLVLFAGTGIAAPKPNIVHIMVDDLGWQDIASHKIGGDTVYETPNLDHLTRMGRRFTEAYSPSPVCARGHHGSPFSWSISRKHRSVQRDWWSIAPPPPK